MTNQLQFEELFRLYYQKLCNYANRYLSNKDTVEDIVQGFFISLWESGALQAISQEKFLPYAYCAIKNRCINQLKHEMVHQDFLVKLANEWSEQIDGEEKDEFIYKSEVKCALEKLPSKCREIFLLKCMSELKYKEIAEITNISVNTVKYHLTEAFRIMRKELEHLFFIILCFFSNLTYPF